MATYSSNDEFSFIHQTVQIQKAATVSVGGAVTFPITLTTAPTEATAASAPGQIAISPPSLSDGTWSTSSVTTSGFTLTLAGETALADDTDYVVGIVVCQDTTQHV